VGITPIRALLEDLDGAPGDIAVVYRAMHAGDVILRDELDALAERRSADIHYILGDHRDPHARDLLSPAHLRQLVPDIAGRDVYLCGPPAMTDAIHASLRGAGVAGRQIIVERFEL
jgi:ferredoxin-NADP reductase